jgi:hypothetical protein
MSGPTTGREHRIAAMHRTHAVHSVDDFRRLRIRFSGVPNETSSDWCGNCITARLKTSPNSLIKLHLSDTQWLTSVQGQRPPIVVR